MARSTVSQHRWAEEQQKSWYQSTYRSVAAAQAGRNLEPGPRAHSGPSIPGQPPINLSAAVHGGGHSRWKERRRTTHKHTCPEFTTTSLIRKHVRDPDFMKLRLDGLGAPIGSRKGYVAPQKISPY
ncbi:hypothetical protein M406DRAFT_75189 [Cryphonectria parasitica EP155]|uniref:Uncharacterized protein n=1 Tax=Cryphonectria parasitica (strain ATCC 38755 / EP155) TaxID=660469 RepID=A0A9P4XZW8_CRYP1|nr:uncharacterized protein M406DRAFT_75189 [Cryphonectria parasitica EP155]KAF3763964.1 hypothetical protein M406DRAFT_75189 [Cryphonectria parasitica EP155]